MNNIYSFLSNVWKELLEENKQNKTFVPFLLLLVTLPISMAVNNILLGVFFISALFYIGKNKLSFSLVYLVPILLFALMSTSYFWSIDVKRTLSAIPKEIALLLVPMAFMIIPAFTRTICNDCNRIRITSMGTFKNCLFDDGVFNLRDFIRNGASNDDLKTLFLSLIKEKPENGFVAEANRKKGNVSESMSTIGG